MEGAGFYGNVIPEGQGTRKFYHGSNDLKRMRVGFKTERSS